MIIEQKETLKFQEALQKSFLLHRREIPDSLDENQTLQNSDVKKCFLINSLLGSDSYETVETAYVLWSSAEFDIEKFLDLYDVQLAIDDDKKFKVSVKINDQNKQSS